MRGRIPLLLGSLPFLAALAAGPSCLGRENPCQEAVLEEESNSGEQLPACVGEPLDPRFFELDPDGSRQGERRQRSLAEWQRRLDANERFPSIAPLGDLDPSKELLVLVPGFGMNFQDAHVLARFADRYQVVIAVTDQRQSMNRIGSDVAYAFESFLGHWVATGERRGVPASTKVRIIGHSYGVNISRLMLGYLIERGVLSDEDTSQLEEVFYLMLDGAWRGIDLPWVFTLPLVKQLFGRAIPVLTLNKLHQGALTVANGTDGMNELNTIVFPERVSVQLVAVEAPDSAEVGPAKQYGQVEAVESWLPQELDQDRGELERVWNFYRHGGHDLESLRSWRWAGTVRNSALKNLFITLLCDSDYPAHHYTLVEEAQRAANAEEFADPYEQVLRRIVDVFEGQHTEFMWTDARFQPWIERQFAAFDAAE
ncbi:MAG: hypothetical protein A2284_07255 [Deltaproteobacteria bacterium RIFOXYA12_FULL_61_11]|nr:MAG: hypothetical protein A2284_07255 [Deltaproteobacteria bacterium RIFOXYA12_FULL_61_11]